MGLDYDWIPTEKNRRSAGKVPGKPSVWGTFILFKNRYLSSKQYLPAVVVFFSLFIFHIILYFLAFERKIQSDFFWNNDNFFQFLSKRSDCIDNCQIVRFPPKSAPNPCGSELFPLFSSFHSVIKFFP